MRGTVRYLKPPWLECGSLLLLFLGDARRYILHVESGMLRNMRLTFLLMVLGMMVSIGKPVAGQSAPDLKELQTMQSRFAPTPLKVDVSGLSPGDRKALVDLIQASRIVNHTFMEQFWSGDLALYKKLQRNNSPLGR